jgi:hypothetical protein
MKKMIIGISGVVILALAVVLFVNAGTGEKAEGKASTEMKADCAKCPTVSTCTDAAKTDASASHEGCTAAKSDSTEKCCPEGAKAAEPSCAATCPMKHAATK